MSIDSITKEEEVEESNLNDLIPKFPNTELYESIDDLPVWRYQAFHNYMLQESGIGSSLPDVLKHLSKMDEYLKNKMYKEALIERSNLNMTFYAITEMISFRHMAYACLVKRIGKHDYSEVINETGLKKVNERLSTMLTTHQNIVDLTEKKKTTSQTSWRDIFLKNSGTT